MKRTQFKKMFKFATEKKKCKILMSPEKFLVMKKENYSENYLTQLKYKIKKRYGAK